MKYLAEIGGDELSVDVEERNGRFRVTVAGRDYDVQAASPEAGVLLLFIGDSVYEARVSGAGSDWLNVKVDGRNFRVRLIDRKHRSPVDQAGDGRELLSAPMPGKVVRILLKPGDDVRAGQGVVVVEAMKMQNEVKSSKSGKVLDVRVAEGETVNAGHVLAVVE